MHVVKYNNHTKVDVDSWKTFDHYALTHNTYVPIKSMLLSNNKHSLIYKKIIYLHYYFQQLFIYFRCNYLHF